MDSLKKTCVCCKKKVSLTTYPCRCGGLYCPSHRSDIDHKCKYDYRAENIKNLSTIMEKVVSKKIEVI